MDSPSRKSDYFPENLSPHPTDPVWNNRHSELLSQVASMLLQNADTQTIVEDLCQIVMKFLDCQVFFNFLKDEKSGRLHLTASCGIEKKEAEKIEWLDVGTPFWGCVSRDCNRFIAEDVFHAKEPRVLFLKEYGIQAYCCHPLVVKDRMVGTLSFGTRTRPQFLPCEIKVMEEVSHLVAMAMDRMEIEQSLRQKEKALRTSQDRLTEVISTVSMIAWEWDSAQDRVTLSKGFEQILGVSPQEAPRDKASAFRFVHPDDLKDLLERFDKASKQGGCWISEFRIIRPNDGKIVWLEDRVKAMRDPQTGKMFLSGFIFDVTGRKKAEREIFDARQRLQTLMEALPVGVSFSDDVSCSHIHGNPEMRRQFEAEEKDNISASAREKNAYGPKIRYFYQGRELSDQELPLQRAVKEKRTVFQELEILLVSGKKRILSVSGAPIFNEKGEVTAGVAVTVDITERKKAEEALRDSEERFKSISEAAFEAILFHDAGKIIDFNEIFLSWFGYSRQEMLTKTVFDLVVPEMHEVVRTQMKTPSSVLYELVGVRKDRTTFPVEIRAKSFMYKGRRARAVSVRDVSRRKQDEQAVLDSRERLGFALETSGMGAWDLDLADHTVLRSLEHDKIFGYEKCLPRWTYEMFLEHILPEDRTMVDQKFKKAVRTRSDWNFECRIRRKDGAIRWIWAAGRHRNDEKGKAHRMAGVVQDITERKKAEEILRRDKDVFEHLVEERTEALSRTQIELEKARRLSDIGELAATVAHELRNPLAAIGLAAFNIQKKSKRLPGLLPHLNNIDKKIHESDQIINNLLFYSRLKPPQFEKVSLVSILEECMEGIQKKIKKQITIKKDLEGVRSVRLEADPVQLKEIFNNILNNSMDAVAEEGGEIQISSRSLDGDVSVSISDNGPGIPESILPKIFDPFFTTKAKGTGLGLSVCRQLVNMHKGRIEAKSELKKGTTIMVSFPKG